MSLISLRVVSTPADSQLLITVNWVYTMSHNKTIHCHSITFLLQVALFGLKFFTSSGQLRWADFDTPLKRQLEKQASSHVIYIGVFYYIDRAYALQDEATR